MVPVTWLPLFYMEISLLGKSLCIFITIKHKQQQNYETKHRNKHRDQGNYIPNSRVVTDLCIFLHDICQYPLCLCEC